MSRVEVVRWLKELRRAMDQIPTLVYSHSGRHRPGGADPLFPVDYNIEPANDNAYDLGSPTRRWRRVHATVVEGALISLD